MPRSSTQDPREIFFVLGGIVLVTAILSLAKSVLIPIALAILLTFILSPAVAMLERRRVLRLPAVLIVVVFALTLIVGGGWIVSLQLGNLARRLSEDHSRDNLIGKLHSLQGTGDNGVVKAVQDTLKTVKTELGGKDNENEKKMEKEGKLRGDTPDYPLFVSLSGSGWAWLTDALGPITEGLGTAFLVLVLVVFMLYQRENLRNRIVRLAGHGQLILTTRALDDGAQRISRYLLMQLFINSGFGLCFSLGLAVMGLISGQHILIEYAILWGFFTGVLRFVPYVGSGLGSVLLVAFLVVYLPGMALPLCGLGLYLVLELVAAQVVEPLLFGHSTGVSPLALLLAAAFWTWLWGPVGLILSTPLTVMLVVLGKYVPQLELFPILLGDEPVLTPDVHFYQRLVARDYEEATMLLEDYTEKHSVEDACEHMLLPALLLAQKDRERQELGEDDLRSFFQAIRDLLDDLPAPIPPEAPPAETVLALGCPASTESDEVALLIFARYLQAAGHHLEVLSSHALSSEVVERIGAEKPAAVCIASIPPGRSAPARYLCKRLRMQYPELKMIVARWGEDENVERLQSRLRVAGADIVSLTLEETRSHLVPLLQLARSQPRSSEEVMAAGKS